MLRLFSLLIIMSLFSSPAWACICTEEKDSLNEVYYIGLVKVETVREMTMEERKNLKPEKSASSLPRPLRISPYIMHLRSLQAYKNNTDDIMIVHQDSSSCGHNPRKTGQIYEMIILQNQNGLMEASHCHYSQGEDWWKKLRENSFTAKPEYESIKKDCADSKGRWRIDNFKGYCLYLATDSGQKCLNDFECEGFCEADLKEEEKKLLSRIQMAKFQNSIIVDSAATGKIVKFPENVRHDLKIEIKKDGKCSQWKNPYGCSYPVNNGMVVENKCFDLN